MNRARVKEYYEILNSNRIILYSNDNETLKGIPSVEKLYLCHPVACFLMSFTFWRIKLEQT